MMALVLGVGIGLALAGLFFLGVLVPFVRDVKHWE